MKTTAAILKEIEELERYVWESYEIWEAAKADGRVGKNATFEWPRCEYEKARKFARLLDGAAGEYRTYLMDCINTAMYCGPNDAHVAW